MVHCLKSVLTSQASLLVFYTMMKIGFEISTTLASMSDITGYLTDDQPSNITILINKMSQSQVLIMYSKNYNTIEKKNNDITG